MNIIPGIIVLILAVGCVGWAFIASVQQYDKHIAEEVLAKRSFIYRPRGIITLYILAIMLFIAGIIILNIRLF